MLTDPDTPDLAGATVAITGYTFAGDGDVLAAATAGTSIAASYNSATETLTLTGTDTLADYQRVLDQVTFAAPGGNPTDFGAATHRILTFTANNGGTSNATATATEIIAVTTQIIDVVSGQTVNGIAIS